MHQISAINMNLLTRKLNCLNIIDLRISYFHATRKHYTILVNEADVLLE